MRIGKFIINLLKNNMARGEWIQKAFKGVKKRGTKGVCTGDKFGGPTCRPGTKRYNMAKNLRKINKGK